MSTPAPLRIVEWNIIAFRRLWRANIVSSFLQPLLYLLAMGVGVGSLVNRNSSSNSVLHGLTYAAFVAPGLLATTSMTISSNENLWAVLDAVVWGRQYQAMAATPLTPRDIVTAQAIWLGIRTGMAGLTVVAVMLLFPDVRAWGLFTAIVPAILGGLAFGLPLGAYAITRDRDISFPVIQRFVIVPLFLFGGAFFPVTQMPIGVRWLAYISPLWHSVELCRAAATSIDLSMSATLGHLGYLVACALIGGVAMTHFAKKRLFA